MIPQKAGRIYEYIDGIGSWSRVKIEGYCPDDEQLACFFDKNLTCDNEVSLKFKEIVKDEIFSKPDEVKELFKSILI